MKPRTTPYGKPMHMLRLTPLLAAVLLAGCPATMPTIPSLGTAPTPAPSPGQKEQTTNIFGIPLPIPAPTPTPAAPGPRPPVATSARQSPPMRVPGRTNANMMALFAKGTVNGEELIGELRTMRETMQAQRTATAMTKLMGTMNGATPGNLQSGQFQDRLVGIAVDAMGELVKQYTVNLSYQALDAHLKTVLDNPSALRSETVRLPSPQGLNEVQMRRTLVMASLVVTARITGRMLKAADADFKSIETGYSDLLGRREKAATVLYELLSRGESARAELTRSLKPADINYTTSSLATMSVKDFSRDLGAQNIALAYLQRSDPKAFADYKAESDKLLPAAQGYLRTVSGCVAFASLLVQFSQEISDVARGKNATEVIALLPLISEFATAVPPLVPEAVKAIGVGVSMPFESSKNFRVGSSSFEDFSTAKDVFRELDRRGASAMLQQGMFRRDTSGLLHRMYMCSPVEAGRLLDTGLKDEDRDQFAQAYLEVSQPPFSFANLFEQPQQQLSPRERSLGDELLRSDYRQRADERRLVFSGLQKKLADEGGYKGWSDEQLLRLIFVNREGQARHAEMQLGDVTVRPVANAQSVFEYESLVESCRRVVDPDAAGSRPTKKPSQKPA